MVDLGQDLLLVVDVLLLLEADHVGDLHLLEGVKRPAFLVLHEEHSTERARAWWGQNTAGQPLLVSWPPSLHGH